MGQTSKIPKELFDLAKERESLAEGLTGESATYWSGVRKRFAKNKGALAGLYLLLLLLLFAIIGPFFNSHGYDEQDLMRANLPPKIPVLENISWLPFDGMDIRGVDQYEAKGIDGRFWFGTDELGRDIWTRVWEGTRVSLYIAILATLLDLVIGVTYGSISAYYGGRVDNIMQRFIEVLVGIPQLIIIILLILIMKPGILTITIAMGFAGWVGMARIVRGNILKLKEQEFVLASRTLGSKDKRLIFRHLLPNTLGPIIITVTFSIPGAVFTEAFLSFIGLGLQPPIASLGTLVNDGFKYMRIYPHQMVISSVVISFIMISFNLIGDGMRDALDPKMRSK